MKSKLREKDILNDPIPHHSDIGTLLKFSSLANGWAILRLRRLVAGGRSYLCASTKKASAEKSNLLPPVYP